MLIIFIIVLDVWLIVFIKLICLIFWVLVILFLFVLVCGSVLVEFENKGVLNVNKEVFIIVFVILERIIFLCFFFFVCFIW